MTQILHGFDQTGLHGSECYECKRNQHVGEGLSYLLRCCLVSFEVRVCLLSEKQTVSKTWKFIHFSDYSLRTYEKLYSKFASEHNI